MADEERLEGSARPPYRRVRGLFHYQKGDVVRVYDWLILAESSKAFMSDEGGSSGRPLGWQYFADSTELLKWFAGEQQELLKDGWALVGRMVLDSTSGGKA